MTPTLTTPQKVPAAGTVRPTSGSQGEKPQRIPADILGTPPAEARRELERRQNPSGE